MPPDGPDDDRVTPPLTDLFGLDHVEAGMTLTHVHGDTTPEADPPPPPFTPDDAAGSPFVLHEELARGAVGAVWSGRDTKLGRDVAVKVLLDRHLHRPEVRRRFGAEARVTAFLQHPAVVPVYDIAEFAGNRPYFAMRLVRGMTLAELLAARPTPAHERPRLLRVFEKVCEGMAYAHQMGVVHRDLKPANVMVGEYGRVKVMDWGVAKLLPGGSAADRLTVIDYCTGDPLPADDPNGRVFGTAPFMAPEQAAGENDRVDERADVFGLGAILCMLLTGRPPYSGADTKAVYKQALRANTAAALERLAGCGACPELIALCVRCLSADLSVRPRSAGEMYLALTDVLDSDHRRAEGDLERFFELSLDLFGIAGMDGHFRRLNPNFARVLGHTTAELLSRPYLDFVHPDDRERTLEVMRAMKEGRDCVQFVNRYRDAAGHYRWLEWTAKSVPADGAIYAVARDLTDRLRLMDTIQELRAKEQGDAGGAGGRP